MSEEEKTKLVKAGLSDEQMSTLIEESNCVYIDSKFSFLKAHNGFRPGCLHVLMSTTHAGKSSLTRSIVLDVASRIDTSVLVWLSEEKCIDFQREIAFSRPHQSYTEKISLVSEQSFMDNNINYRQKIESLILELNPRLFVFDNLTTSRFYNNKDPDQQSSFVLWLKALSQKTEVPLLLIVHTGSKVNPAIPGIITENDIRGSKDLPNMAEFFYIIQKFVINDHWFIGINITKHRGYNRVPSFYRLNYCAEKHLYESDVVINWEDFKEAYTKRNKL